MPGEACAPLPGLLDPAVRLSVLWACAGLLYVKSEYHDEEKRSNREFALDTSKQLLGACWAWLISAPVTYCAAYWRSTMLETTLGVAFEYILLSLLTRLFSTSTGNAKAFEHGEYDVDCKAQLVRVYSIQLSLWIICVSAMKFCTGFLESCYPAESCAFTALLTGLPHFYKVQVCVVMLATPCVMYGLAVWITDDFLRKGGSMGALLQVMTRVLSRRSTAHDDMPSRNSMFMGAYTMAFLADFNKETASRPPSKSDDIFESSNVSRGGTWRPEDIEAAHAQASEDATRSIPIHTPPRQASDEEHVPTQTLSLTEKNIKFLEEEEAEADKNEESEEPRHEERHRPVPLQMSGTFSGMSPSQLLSPGTAARDAAKMDEYKKDRQQRTRMVGTAESQEQLREEPPEETQPDHFGSGCSPLEPIEEGGIDGIWHGCSATSQDFPQLSPAQLSSYRAERENIR